MENTSIEFPNMTDSQKLFASIMQNQITLNTAVNELQEHDAKYRKLLIEGNGELPLVEKVRNVEAFVKEFRYWTKFIFGALILQTITFAVGVIIAVVRFLPVLQKLAQP